MHSMKRTLAVLGLAIAPLPALADGEVAAAVAAEQRSDPEFRVAAGVEVVHEVCSGDGRPRHPCLVEN